MKKVQLKEKFSIMKDTGETQDFFGVPFVCENEKIDEQKFVSVWTAEVADKVADEMVKARRVDLVK